MVFFEVVSTAVPCIVSLPALGFLSREAVSVTMSSYDPSSDRAAANGAMCGIGAKIPIRWDVTTEDFGCPVVVRRFWWPAVVTSVLQGPPPTVELLYMEGYGFPECSSVATLVSGNKLRDATNGGYEVSWKRVGDDAHPIELQWYEDPATAVSWPPGVHPLNPPPSSAAAVAVAAAAVAAAGVTAPRTSGKARSDAVSKHSASAVVVAVQRNGAGAAGETVSKSGGASGEGGSAHVELDACCRLLLTTINDRLSAHTVGRRGRATLSVTEVRSILEHSKRDVMGQRRV